MASCAEIMDEEEIEKMLHYASPDPEGNVNYREFVRTMMSKWVVFDICVGDFGGDGVFGLNKRGWDIIERVGLLVFCWVFSTFRWMCFIANGCI